MICSVGHSDVRRRHTEIRTLYLYQKNLLNRSGKIMIARVLYLYPKTVAKPKTAQGKGSTDITHQHYTFKYIILFKCTTITKRGSRPRHCPKAIIKRNSLFRQRFIVRSFDLGTQSRTFVTVACDVIIRGQQNFGHCGGVSDIVACFT